MTTTVTNALAQLADLIGMPRPSAFTSAPTNPPESYLNWALHEGLRRAIRVFDFDGYRATSLITNPPPI